ncbi:hypothetical protein LTR08_002129 [Meristemomyces frigidus]|nr:hypothetical protein LTR08_002129 [Meristemomyces frigidus]
MGLGSETHFQIDTCNGQASRLDEDYFTRGMVETNAHFAYSQELSPRADQFADATNTAKHDQYLPGPTDFDATIGLDFEYTAASRIL